jgi:hypothetical protein
MISPISRLLRATGDFHDLQTLLIIKLDAATRAQWRHAKPAGPSPTRGESRTSI